MIRKYRNVSQVVELNLPEDPCNPNLDFNFQVKSKTYNFFPARSYPFLLGVHIDQPHQPGRLQNQMGPLEWVQNASLHIFATVPVSQRWCDVNVDFKNTLLTQFLCFFVVN